MLPQLSRCLKHPHYRFSSLEGRKSMPSVSSRATSITTGALGGDLGRKRWDDQGQSSRPEAGQVSRVPLFGFRLPVSPQARLRRTSWESLHKAVRHPQRMLKVSGVAHTLEEGTGKGPQAIHVAALEVT